MVKFLRSLVPSVLAGALTGLVVLGVGGRMMMRIIAHWEGRVPVLTPSGTFTVVMMGTIAGTAAGVIHGLLRRFVKNPSLRILAFLTICVLFTLYGVSGLLPRPRLLFVAITLVFAVLVEILTRRAGQPPQTI
jgi:hypothetical protein